MGRAIEVASSVRASTSPNPWVGAVVDPGGFEGATQPPGGPHAEIVALEAAGEAARGGTLVVTLEPCAHHGRTPPCCDALAHAGIARVVSAVSDPNPLVAGQGATRLRQAGVDVVELDGGPLQQQAAELNVGFFARMRRGTPWGSWFCAVVRGGVFEAGASALYPAPASHGS